MRFRFSTSRLLVVGLAVVLLRPEVSWTAPLDELTVKAAIVYNFSKFVRRQDAVQTGRLCMLGDDAAAGAFDHLLGTPSSELNFEYTRLWRIDDDLTDCRLLFISRSEETQIAEIMTRLADKKILTLSDLPEFIDHGGMVSLDTVRGKIRFSVNIKKVNDNGLLIDSQLLRLARIVE